LRNDEALNNTTENMPLTLSHILVPITCNAIW